MQNKATWILALLFLLLMFGLQWFIKERPTPEQVSAITTHIRDTTRWQGKYAPQFELTLLDGSTFKLADHVGKKVVILNFFTTWCGPCRQEMPELEAYYQKRRTNDLLLLGIDVGEKKDRVNQFVAGRKISFPIGIDADEKIAKHYRVKSYPTTVVIGADGKVALFQIGAIANADVVFDSLLRVHHNIIQLGRGIDSEAYLRQSATTNVPDQEEAKSKIVLSEPAKAFAARMRCPNCGEDLLNCHCNFCESVQKKLSALELKDKTDEQILKSLFMETK